MYPWEVIVLQVLIDADGCPVVDISIALCRKYHVPCVIVCDTAHEFYRDGAVTVIADKGADSADYTLLSKVTAEDVVITQDYGLASMCLAKRARVLHQDGWAYTLDNIDALLLARHEARKFRASGGRTKGPSKRAKAQNDAFFKALESILQTVSQG